MEYWKKNEELIISLEGKNYGNKNNEKNSFF